MNDKRKNGIKKEKKMKEREIKEKTTVNDCRGRTVMPSRRLAGVGRQSGSFFVHRMWDGHRKSLPKPLHCPLLCSTHTFHNFQTFLLSFVVILVIHFVPHFISWIMSSASFLDCSRLWESGPRECFGRIDSQEIRNELENVSVDL